MSFVKKSQQSHSGWLVPFLALSAIGCQHSQRSVLVAPTVQTNPVLAVPPKIDIESHVTSSPTIASAKVQTKSELHPVRKPALESTVALNTEELSTSPEEIATTDLHTLELLQIAQSGSADDLLLAVQAQIATETLLSKPYPSRQADIAPFSDSGEALVFAQGPNDYRPLASTLHLNRATDDTDRKIETALLAAYSIDEAGRSVGLPNEGSLEGGVPLPQIDGLYTIRSRHSSYGSSHTVLQIVTAFESFRKRSGYTGDIVIADMSRKDGGKIRHHASHQIGRDIDILMPVLSNSHAWGNKVDWSTTWKLVRAFLDTGEVEYIFLDYQLQETLHDAASKFGEKSSNLKKWISWPHGLRYPAVVRDSPGHTAHIHVRIHCGPLEPKCRSRGLSSAGDS